ncbi:uracil-DNA glycosylase [Leucobacter chromiireducens]|uniref:Uracil-DNA glycosylase n=1 Tax=Leucobacter chromiireducens subsp. chromiireducens TaxID=660067 RepID=A0ABS1SM31_9MICO|nr:uracil-DNA glycosylase [Leucobacter chromiireducens]MBL3689153.1 uracil-DNA glycosylase [Leucobacter chromiireducens subsp. chromiireducens]
MVSTTLSEHGDSAPAAGTLDGLVAAGRIAADWGSALAAEAPQFDAVTEWLAAEREAHAVLPDPELVFAAFARPLADVRVLIVGQDPYPTPGHPIGLSFATDLAVRPLPRSLQNISRELESDVGATPLPNGDLRAWADQGVLLLNRVLTVRAGEAGSHRGRGWEAITECAIRALAARGGPLVAILWGNDARALAPLLGETPVIESAHPSPLSASRGFFGSRPFSRANEALVAQGAQPIDWQIAGAAPAQPTLWD